MSGAGQSVDPLDSLIDFSEYDGISAYQSPSLSPAATTKSAFVRPTSTVSTPTLATTAQPQLTGPSHQYELYKQQTGLVPGALASTLAVNQSNLSGYTNNYNLGLMTALSPENELFDFNSDPSQGSLTADIDMDFDSPAAEPSFFFPDTVNPTAIGGQEASSSSSQGGGIGRLYPGMHSQAAMAKAQAQQRQQQQLIMQQRHQQQQQQQQAVKPRSKSGQPTDPIVEQKITQLLNSMRAKSSMGDGLDQSPMMNIPRPKKDEDDMDEDERLLASEEGKKLSSKERRQLRNKVSARAFRSRRKEYITQLEAEIANKVSENGDLRSENRALMEENKRLSDLTRMLLSSPSFSNFLDHLSSNPTSLPQQPAPVKMERGEQQHQQRAAAAALPKDVNPYAAAAQQQIGMAMIPEQSMDFSMLSLDNFQPQVYAVLETPEVPAVIDTSILSGKTSNFVGEHFGRDDDADKVDMPVIEHPVEAKSLAPQMPESMPTVVDEEFENDPEFALYHVAGEAPSTEDVAAADIFSGVESEKILARYELVDASQEEQNALLAMARVQRIAASMDHIVARLDRLTFDQ
jgi:hypothetical protein